MKINLIGVLSLIVVGGLIILCIDQGCRKSRFKKEVATYKAKYANCINAPIKVDTLIDTVYIKGKTLIKPVPKIVKIWDTIWIQKEEKWYDTTYKNDGLRFRWKAHTTGTLESVEFSNFVIPYRIIQKTITVDTCFDKPPLMWDIPSNHWGMDVDLYGNRVNKLPNITATVWWTFKDKWGIEAGGDYNTYHNEWYLRTGVRLFFDGFKKNRMTLK